VVIFWDIAQCSQLKVSQRFGGTLLLATFFMQVSCLTYPSNPEDEGDMFLKNID
jgi:hypothetical protein